MKTIKLMAIAGLCGLLAYNSSAQVQVQKVKAGYGVAVTQTEPEFPGGVDGLKTFMHDNLKYPPQLMASRTGGRVLIIFIVDKDGKIVDPTILKGVNDALNEEALRIVKLMPDWKPGTAGGSPVNKQFILPIDFVMPPNIGI